MRRSRAALASRSRSDVTSVLYLVGIFGFLYLPILVLILLAFNDSRMTSFPFRGLTLDWFQVLVEDQKMLGGLYNSFIVALGSTIIAVVVGTISVYVFLYYRFKGRLLFAGLALLPVVAPKTVLGLAILTLISTLEVSRSLATVIFGHVLVCLPFVMIIVGSVMIRIPRSLVEASRDLGSGEWATFRKVVLPLSLNGIVAGAFIAFIISFAEFNLSFFLAGRDQTLPLIIFSEFRFEVTPKINALSTVMVAASVALTVTAEFLRTRRTERAAPRPGGP